ncbi:MAG: type I-E CRISPR-associated endoribonuclease Cas2 [Magnetococcales bacterium]|nr:type I-E CRISPR-associated endoribonuclease Cas2 [Magnetococcales bacterium]
MPMTVVITRDVEARYRGFLTSIMLEVSPGVYIAPDLSAGVRSRMWSVLSEWYDFLGRGAIIMFWRDKKGVSGLSFATLGEPTKELVDADGVILLKRS